jgi:putative transposase
MRFKEHRQYRLPGYDYARPGRYFVTFNTKDRGRWLGDVVDGRVVHSKIGEVARDFWLQLPASFSNLVLDEWVIMPDHVHGILLLKSPHPPTADPPRNPTGDRVILSPMRRGLRPLARGSVSSIVNHCKGNVKRWCNKNGMEYFDWQSRFRDTIIRSDRSLYFIRKYIRENPVRWEQDRSDDDEATHHWLEKENLTRRENGEG